MMQENLSSILAIFILGLMDWKKNLQTADQHIQELNIINLRCDARGKNNIKLANS